jgi:hypothetical protein
MRGSNYFPRLPSGRIDQSAPKGSAQNPGGPILRERAAKPEAPVNDSPVVNQNVPRADDMPMRPAAGKG